MPSKETSKVPQHLLAAVPVYWRELPQLRLGSNPGYWRMDTRGLTVLQRVAYISLRICEPSYFRLFTVLSDFSEL